MTQHLLGPAREAAKAELAARYQAGASLRQLCTETGRSFGGVRYLLAEAGVQLRPRTRIDGPERQRFIAKAVRRYDRGESIRAIAVSTGFSYTAIRDMLVGAHVQLRPGSFQRGPR